ncbi:hypothetical protein A2567_02745 [Candidatus Azambacteria bacterium RIFOXYD1_FULL_42_11]|uniref:Glycoside hydrolase family 42 N-terminal domain-containing protein n=4 Tax=Candidatus Azamiibacteriota TaxID=1752741 RepID=A0A0G0ZBA7_9BACT|nr:MAG: hypothetical protein UV07_C0008G0024 [Candidatus Azambacteria bacterium GW2011_GWB1_42_17]KKS46005.1 MAG: hypothetical protein UV10_C0009G0008 [Candidatus Azambacteria bacterium GW2011_GWA1_42_19]KKS76139.1 MAG: hypothetical protein UV48_C0001G0011 [Candidatus Azambacteria bacterium GW2011_GWA2_42_9]KKS88230.1 MAG: hypothetical protein UV62_C0011G0026 [Parcubacteria group bacterium GW2011_GWC1_43_11]OGD42249.1 MAG: hypothetical protein A2567_02745 [Candidatus Azambacteria bacterium RIFO
MIKTGAIIILSLIVLFFVLFGAMYFDGFYFNRRDFSGGKEPIWGASFRPAYAVYLGLDPKETALAIFDDLKVTHIRLIIPWEDIEKTENDFDFSFFDWFIDESSKRGIKIIPNIGERVAGWPEFHIPDWAIKLSEEKRHERLLLMEEKVIRRYNDKSALSEKIWQVENEPLFPWKKIAQIEKEFGISLRVDPEFLRKEIELVKKVSGGSTIITDSGELSDWKEASKISDYFGTTLYRFFWQRILGDWGVRLYYGYIPPATFVSSAFYNAKTKKLHLDINKVFVMELQVEPWIRYSGILSVTPQKQFEIFGLKQFRDSIEYAKKTGFPRIYLWGAEWLYYQKVHGNSQLWNEAKKLWQ